MLRKILDPSTTVESQFALVFLVTAFEKSARVLCVCQKHQHLCPLARTQLFLQLIGLDTLWIWRLHRSQPTIQSTYQILSCCGSVRICPPLPRQCPAFPPKVLESSLDPNVELDAVAVRILMSEAD